MDVVVFAMDDVADFGLAAVLETFALANSLRETLTTPPPPWRVHTVSTGTSVRSGNGYTIPTIPLTGGTDGDAELTDLGVLIVPAINVLDAETLIQRVSALENSPLLERIGRAHARGVHVAGACTGTFFLAEAGVLDGHSATTSWWLGPAFRKRYPAVMLNEGLTLCRGTTVSTAGASLSHVDLALSLVHTVSPALAEKAARYLVVGTGRTQAGHIVPDVMARGNSLIAAFERWIRQHLGEQLRISSAARELGVTERSLQRATQSELGMSPRDFVNDIRLEHAAFLLRTTSLSLQAVAARVGYLNPGTLRSLVRRRRGMTIAQLRATPLPW
ncbi:GlxA family transcriptional regulator [Nocardia brevicatena]|uniref:GlxA family transcriptional regulator n=1 Tax=Nocardia brevicatena TaxID=37327 RepID=UPI0002E80998|nr:helix-turn-helix domain-containing protein [Nocardia brevicatena]